MVNASDMEDLKDLDLFRESPKDHSWYYEWYSSVHNMHISTQV